MVPNLRFIGLYDSGTLRRVRLCLKTPFGELKKLLGDQEAIEIKGDRFVFAAEVLFSSGSADLCSKFII